MAGYWFDENSVSIHNQEKDPFDSTPHPIPTLLDELRSFAGVDATSADPADNGVLTYLYLLVVLCAKFDNSAVGHSVYIPSVNATADSDLPPGAGLGECFTVSISAVLPFWSQICRTSQILTLSLLASLGL